jgi:hypothetical protein
MVRRRSRAGGCAVPGAADPGRPDEGKVQRLMSAGGMPQIQDISQRASWPLINGK